LENHLEYGADQTCGSEAVSQRGSLLQYCHGLRSADMSMKVRLMGKPATTSEISSILGPADEHVLAEIQCIGPTAEEVREARAWLDADDYMGEVLEKTMNARIRKVYKILRQQRHGKDDHNCGCCA
jgi:hypothetical protein